MSNEGIWVTDTELRATFVNRQMARMLGLDGASIKGRLLTDFVAAEDVDTLKWALEPKVEDSVPRALDLRLIPRDAPPIWVLVNFAILHDSGGQRQGAVLMMSDITVRKDMEMELVKNRELLDEAQRIALLGNWTQDLAAGTLWWSDLMYDLHGLPPSDNITMERYTQCIHPDDRTEVQALYRQAVDSKSSQFEIEYRIVRPDGAVRNVRVVMRIHHQPDGKADFLIGTTQDITLRKKYEDELRQFSDITRHMQVGLYVYHLEKEDDDRSLRLIATNPAATQTLGLDADTVMFQLIDDVFPGLRPQGIPQIFADVIRTGIPRSVDEFVYSDSRVKVGVFAFKAFPLPRRRVGVLFEDVTKQKQNERERREFEQRMQQLQKMESLGRLAGGIAHDFNNLLQTILGNIEIARREMPADSLAGQCLTDAESAGRHAAELSAQMLAYTGKGHLAAQPLNLSRLVREMEPILRVSVSKKATLHFRLEAMIPPTLGDASQLKQVILNLAINASEAMGDRGGPIVITATDRTMDSAALASAKIDSDLPPGRYAVLEVQDAGCGMTPDTIGRIFEPFFSTKFIGRGLGLAVVMGIVRSHKGGLQVASEPGHGTTIRVLLPAVDSPSRDAPTPPASVSIQPEAWGANRLVLVADDEKDVLRMADRMLRLLGFRAITASNGREAVELFRIHQADLCCVLADLTMPILDGREAALQILAIKPDTPILLASGYSESLTSGRLSELPIAGFIRKPYLMTDLDTHLRAVMSKRVHNAARPATPPDRGTD